MSTFSKRGALVIAIILAVLPARAETVRTEANRVVELSFEAAGEAAFEAVFTEPGGQTLRVPGFRGGDAKWRVRYASAAPGVHRFRTESSNAGLNGRTGEVEVRPYTGSNPLFQHGAIRVAADHRHFTYADGSPFFWLGDTWWMGLSRRLAWPEEFQRLAADRREKGFTVVQIVAGLYPDMPAFDERGLGDGGFPWATDYARLRPEYFDAADERIQYLVEQGLAPCIVGAWGYHLPWLGEERMKRHWREVIARWGAYPVVWCAAGELAMPWYLSADKEGDSKRQREGWTEIARYIRATDPFHRLVTAHPRRSARDDVTDPAVLDFDMQQSGHTRGPEQHAALALSGWQRTPEMPVISGESRYEALELAAARMPNAQDLPRRGEAVLLGAREARQAFWAHLLNSGCVGHTYGANGIWQVNRAKQPYGASPSGHNWGTTPWEEAMSLPGSLQISRAVRAFLKLPWAELNAAPELFRGALSGACTADRRCMAAYTTGSQITLALPTRPFGARWIDPSDGSSRTAPAEGVGGSAIFLTRGKNAAGDSDWILVIEQER